MPLSQSDYGILGYSHTAFYEKIQSLSEETRHYIVNATQRLTEAEWVSRKIDKDILSGTVPIAHEGLLSLLLYLLITCADVLGHTYSKKGVGQRFRLFFLNLPQLAKDELMAGILCWKTKFADLVELGLADTDSRVAVYPSKDILIQEVNNLSLTERFDAVIESLYFRRNYYTHEADYPQLGYHPNLSVLHRQRFNVPNTSNLGHLDRLQLIMYENEYLFVYYETDDITQLIRQVILHGLGRIIMNE